MRLLFCLFFPLLFCGCLAYGSAHVRHGDVVANATYFRLGDQRLQDFYVNYDRNGTAELGLGQQQSDAAELRAVLLKALGVAQ